MHVPKNPNPSKFAKKTNPNVMILIEPELVERLCKYTGHDLDSNLPYLLTSDPDSRTLRILFLKRNHENRVFHVAFSHNDHPGAIATVCSLLESANVNILMSLLRHQGLNLCNWEVMIEHKIDFENKNYSDNIMKLGKELMKVVLKNKTLDNNLAYYDVQMDAPVYPLREGINKIPLYSNNVDTIKPERDNLTSERLCKMFDKNHCQQEASAIPDTRRNPSYFINAIRSRLENNLKPRIFLSYPQSATLHAKQVRELLESNFEVCEYQKPDFKVIVDHAVSLINQCDYFIGIWHHEDRGNGEIGISPWMPFEYGAALSSGSESIIVHSDKLPREITRRINREVGSIPYKDVSFQDTAKEIEKYCRDNWYESYPLLK